MVFVSFVYNCKLKSTWKDADFSLIFKSMKWYGNNTVQQIALGWNMFSRFDSSEINFLNDYDPLQLFWKCVRERLITSKEGLFTSFLFGFNLTLFIQRKTNKCKQEKKKSYPRTFPPVLGAPIYKSATALRIKNCCRLCHGSRNQMNINKYLTSTWDLLQNTGENRECFITGTSWGHFPWRSSIWVQMWSKLWDKVAWKAQQSYIDWDKN